MIAYTNGTSVDLTTAAYYVFYIATYSATNLWGSLYRSFYSFDTSSLGAGASISGATFGYYGYSKSDGLSCTPSVNLYGWVPSSNANTLVNGDYSKRGTTAFCDTPITYSGWSTSGYNNFALNASGIGNISKTGVSCFSLLNDSYDVAGTQPNWVTSAASYLRGYTSDNGSNEPQLVVTYTSGAVSILSRRTFGPTTGRRQLIGGF